MDRPEIGRRRDRRRDLPIGNEADERRHHHEERGPHHAEARLHQHGVDRLLELLPAGLVVAHIDEHAYEHREHVLQHDALRDDRAARQNGHDPHDHDEGNDQDAHRLPERVREVASHLCAARNCASASSCDAFIIVPNVLGMIPASFSYPLAIDDMGSRIFLRMDSASRREPTCVRSGAMVWPWPSSLWQARQPAAWMVAFGSVDPPAKPPPPPPPPPPPGGEVVEVLEVAGISEAVTSTVPPCDSRKAITAQICCGESCFVITGMIGW